MLLPSSLLAQQVLRHKEGVFLVKEELRIADFDSLRVESQFNIHCFLVFPIQRLRIIPFRSEKLIVLLSLTAQGDIISNDY